MELLLVVNRHYCYADFGHLEGARIPALQVAIVVVVGVGTAVGVGIVVVAAVELVGIVDAVKAVVSVVFVAATQLVVAHSVDPNSNSVVFVVAKEMENWQQRPARDSRSQKIAVPHK